MYSELAAVYNALRAGAPAPDLAPLPIQYPDYAAWQRARLQRGELEAQVPPPPPPPPPPRVSAGLPACLCERNMAPTSASVTCSAKTADVGGSMRQSMRRLQAPQRTPQGSPCSTRSGQPPQTAPPPC